MHRDFRPPEDGPTFITAGRVSGVGGIATDFRAALQEAAPLRSWVRGRRTILHAHSRFGIFASCLVNRLSGVPVVIHLHSLANHPWLYRWLQRMTRATLIYNSRKTCRHFGDDPATARILMPPIHWPTAPPAEAQAGPRFLAAGAFVPSKHFHVILEAYTRLRAGGDRAELVIFGLSDAPLDAAYQRRMVDACQGQAAIHLRPWTPDWADQLTAKDIFIHAGEPESFGIVLLEAFARGCRLIVLPDTFLNDLPEPLGSAGIHRLGGLTVAALTQHMKLALAEIDTVLDLWPLRSRISRYFSLEYSVGLLADLYRPMSCGTRYN